MKRIRKLVASIAIMGMAFQMFPVRAMASEVSVSPPDAWGAVPSAEQIQYHEEELAAFIHFGMNTFTNSEWGNGRENPNSFNPTDLDPMQWVKTLKDAGFKRLIMVGKHHDGFAIWQSEYTEHDVANSTDWQKTKGGTGDVLEEVSKACTYYDMDMGIYLSPWDANATSYGYGTGTNEATDSNGDYNEYYMNQLREILDNEKYGNNGKFVEVWMDGAKGSGAAAQNYKFKEWFDLIEELQPGAVVFSPYGTAVRWIGNESGIAGDPVWSKVNYSRIVNRYDAGLSEESGYLNSGDPNGDIWSVGECDVSLTSGWFWHNGNSPKTMEQLSKIYFSSVGRGQPLLLNVAPDNRGKFTDNDIARVKEFGDAVKNTFKENLADKTQATVAASSVRGNSDDYSASKVIDNDKDTYWTMDDGQTTGSITIDLGGEKTFDIVSIEEYIKLGQRISKFKVEVLSNGNWKDFGSGYTIGAKRLVRGTSVKASKVKITVEEALAVPLIENVEIYKADKAFAIKSIAPEGTDFIDNVNFDNKNNWTQENIGIGNTGMYSATAGNHTSFTFTGSKAWVIGTFDPSHGIMEVWVDGNKVTDVDTYKATRAISQILYETEDLDYGTHTVKVVIKGQKNVASRGNFIGIDGGYYLNNNGSGMFEIEKGNYTIDEGKTQELTIKRVGGSVGEATVHFSTSPDSAVHGRHYNDVNKTIEFADGQTTAKVTIEAIENTEKSGDLKFYCSLDNPSNGAILGFTNTAEVTIKDNDVDTAYTVENPFVMPSNLTEGKLLEAELFTLDPITGTKYVRISEDSKASNGKMVTWFEAGNKIKVPFYAAKAGTYTFKMSYQSGRSEGNLNKVNWSGTNIVSGSKSVPGTGNQNPVPIITTSFDVEVSKAGPGELIFTADSQASPNIDVFEVTAKELVEVTHKVTATAGENGTISPAGVTTLKEGESATFTFTPDKGYEVEDVLVDNVSVGAVSTYTVSNISKDMNISVKFRLKNIIHGEENPIILSSDPIVIEAEKLEIDGVGGEIENKDGASGGKLVGWLGLTSRGNAWLNMWVNAEEDGLYDVEVRYFSGANDTLYYENIDKSVSGSLQCDKTEPNFGTKTIRVSLKKGLDKIKFFNDTKSTANIDSIKISKVVVNVDKTELNTVIADSEALDLSKYTPSSLEKFNEALNSAKAVAANENATQEDVNKAIESLNDAISKLVVKGDKSVLGIVVEYAEEVKLNGALENVVPAVADEFEAALLEAKTILADENSSEATIDLSIKRLVNVIHMLEFKKGDKAELIKLVEIIKALDESQYIPSTWDLLKPELENANKVIADENAMKEEVTTTYNKLIKAFLDLRLKPSKDKLQDLINKVESLDSSKYTKASWNVLEKELLAAKDVIANENATAEEIASSEKSVELAINSLVKAGSDNNNGNDNEEDNNGNDGNNNNNSGNNGNNNNGNSNESNGNNNNNGDKNDNNKLPETGSEVVILYSVLGFILCSAGVILLLKKKSKVIND